MMNEVRRLYALGMAIHWLRSKSKVPLESGWTTGPRKTLKQLEADFNPKRNIGVRLGNASKLTDGTYLGVIDCDVKSKEAKHIQEMEQELSKLFPEIDLTPTVLSGRGNGSKHLYVKTTTPLKPSILSKSEERIAVHMPSAVKVSNKDRLFFSDKQIKDGWRLRPAWEIALMSEGQQVVLPPSIHPDSKKKYQWDLSLDSVSDLFLMNGEIKKITESKKATLDNFKPIEVDPLDSRISEEVMQKLLSPDGDHSAVLFGVCMSLCKNGLSDLEILSLLTDREYALSLTAYRHKNEKNPNSVTRCQAALWVKNYTLDKARNETSAANDFSQDVEEDQPLDAEASKKQEEELKQETPWEQGFAYDKNKKLKGSLTNAFLILQNEEELKGSFGFDEFASQEMLLKKVPWAHDSSSKEVEDADTVFIRLWLNKHFGTEFPRHVVEDAVTACSREKAFHPVRSFLLSLPDWDGVERINTWLKDYAGVEAPEPYLSQISRITLIGMVARVMRPGIKYDNMLILEGKQNTGKSTLFEALAGHEWFSDSPVAMNGDKDGPLNLQGKWIVEMGELTSISRSSVEEAKRFITTRKDRFRSPYGKRPKDYPRQCILVGTSNNFEYLRDATGNRRYWPVTAGVIDIRGLQATRTQLFAEALVGYRAGEKLYLEGEADDQACVQQNLRYESDEWGTVIIDFFLNQQNRGDSTGINPEKFTMSQLFSREFGPLGDHRMGKSEQIRAGIVLKKLGATKKQSWKIGEYGRILWCLDPKQLQATT